MSYVQLLSLHPDLVVADNMSRAYFASPLSFNFICKKLRWSLKKEKTKLVCDTAAEEDCTGSLVPRLRRRLQALILSCLARENHLYITFVCCAMHKADETISSCGQRCSCFHTILHVWTQGHPSMWFDWLDLNVSSMCSCCIHIHI